MKPVFQSDQARDQLRSKFRNLVGNENFNKLMLRMAGIPGLHIRYQLRYQLKQDIK